jgi:hypothetical protein
VSAALSFEVFGKPVTQGSKAWALWRVAVSEAASHRASLLRAPNPQGYGLNYPAPTLVTVTVSDPITWPVS